MRTPNIPWKRKGGSLLTQLLRSATERIGPLEFGIFKFYRFYSLMKPNNQFSTNKKNPK